MTRPKKSKDPHFHRESAKYNKPVPSREFITEYLTQQGVPVSQKQVFEDLGPFDADEKEAIRRRLQAMLRDGQLLKSRAGRYYIAEQCVTLNGTVRGHKDGHGYLVPEDGSAEALLKPRDMRRVLHGDYVKARILTDIHGNRYASIAEIVERRILEITGRYYREKGVGFVEPDDKRFNREIIIPKAQAGDAESGDYVLVHLEPGSLEHVQTMGTIVKTLGNIHTPGIEVNIAVKTYHIPHEWPQHLKREVKLLGKVVSEQDKVGRLDLRDLPLVTIDGEDARDFDDAVYCEPKPKGGWRLIVAIADVSHYARPGTILDDEAYKRGTSVYFPGQVIPMLPEVLSNGLCSLNPEEDRLCIACEMHVTPQGKVSKYDFHQAVMHSKARLTYTKVAAMLEGEDSYIMAQYAELLPYIYNLYAVYQALNKERQERGAINFETTETKIIFNKQRKIEKIVPLKRNDAHKLIEECMIAANVCAAKFLKKHKMPLLYRIHEGPSPEKLEDLPLLLSEFGVHLPSYDDPRPKDYANLMEHVADRPDSNLIQMLLLRSLKQAVYSPKNVGHFGLALPIYAHFTSPIRRYPDLLVHRAICAVLNGKQANIQTMKNQYDAFGEHCSKTERRADEATRMAESWLKCEYMLEKVGQEFTGIISSVTSFGIFVTLDEIYVDGLVHITVLGEDYFRFDPAKHRLIGERSNIIYKLGDAVTIKVARVDLDEKHIDFALVAKQESVKKKKRKKKSSGS